ncbi:MAG: tetratricopeptide repeat protein [Bacteroidia bacterium]
MIGAIACTSNKANTIKQGKAQFAPLKERNTELAKLPDWELVKSKATEFFSNIKNDSLDLKSKLLLAQLYMQEARITGEHPYYYPATLTILDDVIKHDNENFEAHAFKASVLLSLHHFKEALEVGTKAASINGNNGFIYGVLCDANVELGNYEEAVKMSDRMQSLRPGLESYSRASYLREIYGDNTGAIEAMKMAFQAGLAGSEEASWAGNTLSHLYENTGDLKNAEEVSLIILQQRPSYAFATDALGRIEMAKGNYDKAIVKFDEAIKVMPEVSFYENKAEALKLKGDLAKANEIYKTCITMLSEDSESGHYVDMELAKIYLELGDIENAMKYAKTEYNRRPNNIDANHCMAWVYYTKGNFAEAKKYMDKAMRMGTKNAELLAQAGQIEMAAGNSKLAAELMAKSKKINPNMPNTPLKKS